MLSLSSLSFADTLLSPSSLPSQTLSSLLPSSLPYHPSPMAPGIDYSSAPVTVFAAPAPPTTYESVTTSVKGQSPSSGIYYNPRLDPKNYLDGPLSWNPATRLRQMLARPGIVVSLLLEPCSSSGHTTYLGPLISRLLRVSVTVSARDAP